MAGLTAQQRLDYAKGYATTDYTKLFGHAPDEATLATLVPVYEGSNPNVHDLAGGMAAVAKLWQADQNQKQNDPTVLAQKQRDSLLTQAPKYYGDIQGQFKSVLGRQATQAELDHFAPMFAAGNADAYSVGQALQALPEYTQKQDTAAQADLKSGLQTADQEYFTKNLAPAITSQFAQSGRVADGTSQTLANAFANAGAQQNAARDSYLAQTGYANYANNRQTLINNYLGNQGIVNQNNSSQRLGQQALAADTYGVSNSLTDYGMQQSAYQAYLQSMGRRTSSGLGSTIGSGIGTVAGGVIGAYYGGPAGASAGASIGGAGGKAVGGMFDTY